MDYEICWNLTNIYDPCSLHFVTSIRRWSDFTLPENCPQFSNKLITDGL
jgi:hypothetical protein